jgi:uncharacterized repeat protein (TIGR03803 family)
MTTPPRLHRLLVAVAAGFSLCASVSAAVVVQFDINDNVGPSATESGWTGVTGAANDADTISGTDGVRTLTLSTAGDGQDRNRTTTFTANQSLWRDFWFVSTSTVGGATATATVSGLAANTSYIVEIWAYDTASTGARSTLWTDSVTGNTGTLTFNGATTAVPASLSDSVTSFRVKTNGTGVLTLTGAAASGGSTGLPNIFVSGLRISTDGGYFLPSVEAESGTLGSEFGVNTLGGVANITISPTGTGSVPGSAARVATYFVTFPEVDIYQLYARVYVGPATYADDSFFYASSFGAKSPTSTADWVAVLSGLVETGFTSATDTVTDGGGAAGSGVWKWVKFPTYFTVPAGGLTQTFQLGGREDGFYIDRFVFGPADTSLTVAELTAGNISVPTGATFDGPDGIALHRFGELVQGANLDGANPVGGLALLGGSLYGTTLKGGTVRRGTAFLTSVDGTAHSTVLTFSDGTTAAGPAAGFTVSGTDSYGATLAGGTSGTGTIFRRQSSGAVTILRSFAALSAHNGTNSGGAGPDAPPALAGSTLYGTASAGGAYANGALYSLSTDGSGFATLHDFTAPASTSGVNADGSFPVGGLVVSAGKLYGVASAGGSGGAGVVFSLDTSGANFTVLRAFAPLDAATSTNAGGAFPLGGLVLSNGVLYGTTSAGGAGGQGTVFALGTNGTGFAVLHDFGAVNSATGANADGASPVASLALAGQVLYGTTSAGGDGATGTVFGLDTADLTFTTLHAFEPLASNGVNAYGAYPVAPVLRVGKALYGVAFGGGPGAAGTVFRIPIPMKAALFAAQNPGGGIDLTFEGAGAPLSAYTIQATDDLAAPTAWQTLATPTADARGKVSITETNQTSPRRFYRLVDAP